MNDNLKRALRMALPVGVSVALVVWVVRDIKEPEKVWSSLFSASIPLLAAIIPVYLFSHFLRALRWRRFIGQKVSLFHSFSSLMIGYAVNGILPRGGEVARMVNMNRISKVPLVHLLTTIVAERILDMVILLGMIGVSIYLGGERVAAAFPMLTQAAPFALATAALGFLGLLVLAVWTDGILKIAEAILGRIHPKLAAIAERIIRQAAAGLAFTKDARQVAYALTETVVMWSLYVAAFALGLAAYGLLSDLGAVGTTVSYSITSASAFVPSAGQIGPFHTFGQGVLHLIYGVDSARALAFVTVLHLLLFYGIAGTAGIGFWIAQIVLDRKETETQSTNGSASAEKI